MHASVCVAKNRNQNGWQLLQGRCSRWRSTWRRRRRRKRSVTDGSTFQNSTKSSTSPCLTVGSSSTRTLPPSARSAPLVRTHSHRSSSLFRRTHPCRLPRHSHLRHPRPCLHRPPRGRRCRSRLHHLQLLPDRISWGSAALTRRRTITFWVRPERMVRAPTTESWGAPTRALPTTSPKPMWTRVSASSPSSAALSLGP